ncbi:hypothetical protein pb186bvf_008993 [Paramecium bursaria]
MIYISSVIHIVQFQNSSVHIICFRQTGYDNSIEQPKIKRYYKLSWLINLNQNQKDFININFEWLIALLNTKNSKPRINNHGNAIQQQVLRMKKKKKKRPLNTVVEVQHQKGLTIKLKTRITSACYFTLLEDQKILELVLAQGPKFNKISKLFPGKTISMVKNRYYKYLRFKWDQILGSQYTFMNQTDCSTTEGQTCLR